MICPEPGLLRAALDHEEADGALAHLEECRHCRRLAEQLAVDAAHAATAIRKLPAPRPSIEAVAAARERARRRLGVASAEERPVSIPAPFMERESMTFAQRLRHWRGTLAALAAALLLVFLVGTPMGRSAAAQFLAQFRTERLAVIEFDPRQHEALFRDLEDLGTVEVASDRAAERDLGSVAEASGVVGFPVQQPDADALPAGFERQPQVRVLPATQIRFRFDRDRASERGVSMPASLDGAALVVNVPAAVVLHYERSASGNERSVSPGIVVGQAAALTAAADGQATLEEIRSFLLDLPGLSPSTRRQLQAIDDWRNTLPIPVPTDTVQWRQVRIAGGEGLLLEDRSGLGSAALWLRDGRVYGIFGPVDGDAIQRVANSMG